MINKKFLSCSLVAVSLAVGVAFYSCNKNDLTPADDGKNLAGELCDCFTKAGNDDTKLSCISDFESKREKWRDEADAKAFEDTYKQEIDKCGKSPYEWLYTYWGQQAVTEFCDFFSANPDAGLEALMTGGLYSKYGDDFYEPVFMETVLMGLLAGCDKVPDWFYCAFGLEDYCPDDLEALGLQVAEELCNCLAAAGVDEQAMQACLYGLYDYFGFILNPASEFTVAFYSKVDESCPQARLLIEMALAAVGSGN